MTWKRILGAVLALAGIALLLTSFYIKGEVAKGQRQIESAQQKLDTGRRLFSVNPQTQQVGDSVASPIQKKIDAGSATVAEYLHLAGRLEFYGFLSLGAGALLILFGKKRE